MEVLNRLPNNDHLKPYSPEIMQEVMKLLDIENEENVLVCLRIIIELHKTYRAPADRNAPPVSPLEKYVEPFLEFVIKIYDNLQNTVATTFDKPPKVLIHYYQFLMNIIFLLTFH